MSVGTGSIKRAAASAAKETKTAKGKKAAPEVNTAKPQTAKNTAEQNCRG